MRDHAGGGGKIHPFMEMMNGQYLLLQTEDYNPGTTTLSSASVHHQPAAAKEIMQNITTTFLRCIKWQVEETTDPVNCPYHYFCDSSYPGGDYPLAMDILVLLFTATLFLVTLVFTIQEIVRIRTSTSSSTTAAGGGGGRRPVIRYNCGGRGSRQSRRYWIPSGPIALPFILLSLAKGYRINTLSPLAECIGPTLFQLLQISALAFPNDDDDDDNMEGNFNKLKYDIKYILFELSTVSGILHASLFLDYIIMPYYTGLDALMSSTNVSGECASCKLVSYRGWSMSMFSVVGVLCLKTVSRLLLILLSYYDNEVHMATVLAVVKLLQLIIQPILETTSWILISIDSIYLMMNSPESDGSAPFRVAAYGCACFLISLHVLTKLQSRRIVRASDAIIIT
ncbi:hypothetical protein MKW94_026417 [Papaver nudicaule]|uniref:Uncharacterized protein n=1 Tax=Papaver nudicaule TaxID=74823 RepID=A0AA42AS13_PAPNU|nr:hypothetical protein [Papaver nudicaule]